MENAEVARALAEIADLLELTGGNPSKGRAYRRAAQVIDVHPGSVVELWRAGRVAERPGVGAHIAEKNGELVETGECREHARLSALVPHGVVEMLRLEGVGPKTVEAVWKKLGIAGIEVDILPGSELDLPDLPLYLLPVGVSPEGKA